MLVRRTQNPEGEKIGQLQSGLFFATVQSRIFGLAQLELLIVTSSFFEIAQPELNDAQNIADAKSGEWWWLGERCSLQPQRHFVNGFLLLGEGLLAIRKCSCLPRLISFPIHRPPRMVSIARSA